MKAGSSGATKKIWPSYAASISHAAPTSIKPSKRPRSSPNSRKSKGEIYNPAEPFTLRNFEFSAAEIARMSAARRRRREAKNSPPPRRKPLRVAA